MNRECKVQESPQKNAMTLFTVGTLDYMYDYYVFVHIGVLFIMHPYHCYCYMIVFVSYFFDYQYYLHPCLLVITIILVSLLSSFSSLCFQDMLSVVTVVHHIIGFLRGGW